MHIRTIRMLTVLAMSAVFGAVAGQTIKLASLAPSGSPYDEGLRAIAADWEKISGGAIKMIIYSGGVAGDEDDMIRKMKIGQLQAAGITGVGLCRLVKDIITIQLPLLVRTNDELFHVMDKMAPAFDRELEQKGVKVLVWMPVGWVHYFAKQPIPGPRDLQKLKMFVWAGDPDGVQAWKEMGFHPIPLSATDIMSSLQSGMVEAFAGPPLSAASYQWFTQANNMCELKWAPLIGAVTISTTVWNRIKPELQPRLLESIRRHGAVMNAEILRADEQAIDAMKQNGLIVNPVSAEQEQEWKKTADQGLSKIEGKSFDARYRQMVTNYVEEYRQQQKK